MHSVYWNSNDRLVIIYSFSHPAQQTKSTESHAFSQRKEQESEAETERER